MLAGQSEAIEASGKYFSPRNAERPARKTTEFIILHTTEAPSASAVRKLSQNGEAHYMVDAEGRVYRLIDKDRVAFHAGRSMWNGKTDIDNYSVAIEVCGYHNKTINGAQISSIKELVAALQKIYNVPDDRVLPHSMVAYGAPNRWFKRSHRGRKRCGMQFATPSVRQSLGLTSQPGYDPDVRAGRLIAADPHLASTLFGGKVQSSGATVDPKRAVAVLPKERPTVEEPDDNIISSGRSAWDVARDKYNSAGTTYVLPDGSKIKGNAVKDWNGIPVGTKVVMAEGECDEDDAFYREIGPDGDSPFEVAGDDWNSKTTIYFMPNGRIVFGNQINPEDVRKISAKTRVLVGYEYGGRITAKQSAFILCGKKWNFPTTVYLKPDGSMIQGSSMRERSIPLNTLVYYRK